jgi:hypothetical protein
MNDPRLLRASIHESAHACARELLPTLTGIQYTALTLDNVRQQVDAQRRVLKTLDATVGGEQLVEHLARQFTSKRFSEVCRLIHDMVRTGELEDAGCTEQRQMIVRRAKP